MSYGRACDGWENIKGKGAVAPPTPNRPPSHPARMCVHELSTRGGVDVVVVGVLVFEKHARL